MSRDHLFNVYPARPLQMSAEVAPEELRGAGLLFGTKLQKPRVADPTKLAQILEGGQFDALYELVAKGGLVEIDVGGNLGVWQKW